MYQDFEYQEFIVRSHNKVGYMQFRVQGTPLFQVPCMNQIPTVGRNKFWVCGLDLGLRFMVYHFYPRHQAPDTDPTRQNLCSTATALGQV